MNNIPKTAISCTVGGENHQFEPRYDMLDWRSDAARAVYVQDVCSGCGKIANRGRKRNHDTMEIVRSILPLEFWNF